MFSGIVETTSRIVRVEDTRQRRGVWIRKPRGWKLKRGESVCVEGVCSTVTVVDRGDFQVIYMPETLRRSTFRELTCGYLVNLERSLTLKSLIGGHLVQGHVDTTARIASVLPEGEARVYEFRLPVRFARYMVEKGSVTVDGISLTVVRAARGSFTASLLAYTLNHTTLGSKQPGQRVNIEVDILAKYVEKLLCR